MLGLLGRDCILLADRGYDSDALRAKVADAGALANIRPLDHRTDPPAFNPLVYKYRNRVERFFSRIKHFRAAATRFAPVPSPYRPIYAGAPCAACTLLELGVDIFAHSGVREPQK